MREEIPALTQPSTSDSPDAPAAGRPAPPDDPGRRSGWPVAVALAVAAGAAIVGWQVFELRANVLETRTEVAQRLAAGDSALAEARALTRQQQESIATLQGKIGALEAHVTATEGQTAALEDLYQEFSRTREDRALAEAEQAINIAAQQLQLAGNFEAALIALQGAEARLAALDRGQLQPLRRAIARDIERLKATPQVDVQGIALGLEALLESVDTLPLAFASELKEREPTHSAAADEADPAARPVLDFMTGLAAEVWGEIRSLLRVERLDQSDPALLAPAQSTFLRENLKIRLLTARLALLARDGRTYAADLAQARSWIERFFDLSAEAVQRARTELATLQAMPVKVEQAGPTESFAALRLLQARSNEVQSRRAREPNGGVPAGSAEDVSGEVSAAEPGSLQEAAQQEPPHPGATPQSSPQDGASQAGSAPSALPPGAAAPGTATGAEPAAGQQGAPRPDVREPVAPAAADER